MLTPVLLGHANIPRVAFSPPILRLHLFTLEKQTNSTLRITAGENTGRASCLLKLDPMCRKKIPLNINSVQIEIRHIPMLCRILAYKKRQSSSVSG